MDQERINEIREKLTLAYIAGFFDGEGSVSYSNRRVYSLQVTINQSNEEILLAIAQFFGIGTVKQVKQRLGHKKNFSIVWCGQKAKAILEALLPYLIVKADRAELGIKLASLAKPYGDHTPVSLAVQLERDSVAKEIRRLNDSHWSRRPESVNCEVN